MNRRGFFALLAGAGIAPKLLAAAKSPAIAQQLPFPVPRPRPGMPQWYEWSAFPRPVAPKRCIRGLWLDLETRGNDVCVTVDVDGKLRSIKTVHCDERSIFILSEDPPIAAPCRVTLRLSSPAAFTVYGAEMRVTAPGPTGAE